MNPFRAVLNLTAWLLPFFAAWLAQAQSATHSVAPEPSWVAAAELEREWQPASAFSGLFYRLMDQQVDVASESVYRRHVKKLTTEQGVADYAQINLAYEPSHQRLAIHKIGLWRDGRWLERLKPEALRVVQQESDAHRQIYNGEQTVIAILDDVRVGDEIEYSYTITGFNPIFGGRYADWFLTQWSVPTEESRVRILWPKGRAPLRWRLSSGAMQPEISELAQSRVFNWRFRRNEPVQTEDRLPVWFNPYPYLELSEFESWGDVRDWARNVYASAPGLPTALIDEIESMIGRHETLEKRALGALRFVQEQIRYLGIEIGPNSHKPHDPSTVFARRFGDCKDKSVLLCAIFDQMGIEARPAAVHSYASELLDSKLPSPLAFNHMIVRARIGSQTFWLDPTIAQQRGTLNDVSVDYCSRALVIDEREPNLVEIPRKALEEPQKVVKEHFKLPSYEGPAELIATTIYSGAEAEAMRRTISSYSKEELEKSYVNFYLRRFSGVRASRPLSIEDDTDVNRITVRERYMIERPWSQEGAARQASLEAFSVAELTAEPATLERKLPLGVPFPAHVRHEIVAELPAPGAFPNERKAVDDAFQQFAYEARVKGSSLFLTFDYRTKTNSVPVEKVEDYVSNLRLIQSDAFYGIRFPTSPTAFGWARINWPIAILALITAGVVLFASVTYYRRQSSVTVPTLPDLNRAGPAGLRGWLLLVGVNVVLLPLLCIGTIFQIAPAFFTETWHTLTSPQNAEYHPLWGALLIGELIGNMVQLGIAGLMIPLFFKRKIAFPRVYIAFLIFNMCFVLADLGAMHLIPATANDINQKDHRGAFRATFGAVIWCSYMRKSVRVRNTFVH